jgi:hypothetical protein
MTNILTGIPRYPRKYRKKAGTILIRSSLNIKSRMMNEINIKEIKNAYFTQILF